jgi:hypothetical protein
MLLKKFESKRLFYKKYPYKLSWYSPLSHYFRGGDPKQIKKAIGPLHLQRFQNKKIVLRTWNKEVPISHDELDSAQKVLDAISKYPNRVRVEGRGIQVYSEDRDWLHDLATEIDAQEWWEPEEVLTPDTVIMGKSMRGWEYRITLGYKVPESFVNWAVANIDKIKVGPTFKKMLIHKRSNYFYGMYFYVKSDKVLDLAMLVLGRGIARIDKIIIEDKKA